LKEKTIICFVDAVSLPPGTGTVGQTIHYLWQTLPTDEENALD
jgi:hypothetical protein